MKRLFFGSMCFLSLFALALSGTATSSDAQKQVDDAAKASCNIVKKQVTDRAAVCPDEFAVVSKVDCADVRSYKLMELLKLNETCVKRGTGKGVSASKKETVASKEETEETAPSTSVKPGGKKCRALIDGEVAFEAQDEVRDGTVLGCLKVLREKVQSEKCAGAEKGTKIPYVMQTMLRSGRWTEGTSTSARCK